jgi:choline dehydrogenase-like flavoprotein
MPELNTQTRPPVIIGSGAAGTAAALALVRLGIRPTMLDVGRSDPGAGTKVQGNLYDYRKQHDTFDLFIGEGFQGVSDVLKDEVGVAKLNAPNMAFITQDVETLSPVETIDFDPIQSFALGGLGNGWGSGLYRFTDDDLAGFPIRAADLASHFDTLTAEIGISGAEDDLAPYFGVTSGLLPPLKLSYNAEKVYASYRSKRQALVRRGVTLGRPRLGVLSVEKDGRAACDYSNTEFWQDAPYLYTPTVTLKRLIAAGQVDYRPGLLVQSWMETAEGVTVNASDIRTGQPVKFTGGALLLAAGAIGTGKIVLASQQDYETALPLLENPAVQIPFVLPTSIGRALDTHVFGLTQLNLIWESDAFGCRTQGSFLELTSPMRAEFFGRFPLSARANLRLVHDMLPAMLLMQLYLPGSAQPPARIVLKEGGVLRIEGHPNAAEVEKLSGLLAALRSLGLWTLPMLVQKSATGHAIHYAGTLPMSEAPARYQCDPAGKLAGTRRVYIADSACFSALPAKNMSFGMMANAMRVATVAARA